MQYHVNPIRWPANAVLFFFVLQIVGFAPQGETNNLQHRNRKYHAAAGEKSVPRVTASVLNNKWLLEDLWLSKSAACVSSETRL